MQKLLTDNVEKLKTLCKKHNVRSLFAFGSVCTDNFNDNSDVDLLISFNQMDYGDYADNYLDLADKFEKIFKRPVDLVTDKSLSNPYFIESFNKTKTLLFISK
ncbi:MAG: nucleotidyltransferase domain-containing protein [Prolixibacteraceae bacterium]|nr:nucleotidyltransferase domain-containing protein [Prolixibacteraceae bacterium]